MDSTVYKCRILQCKGMMFGVHTPFEIPHNVHALKVGGLLRSGNLRARKHFWNALMGQGTEISWPCNDIEPLHMVGFFSLRASGAN